MPLYTFFNPKTEEHKDIIMSMNDIHEYTDETGYKWQRVFYAPQSSVDTKCDPYSAKDFTKATNKKGTLGDLWDRSKELGIKRKEKDGIDFVKKQTIEKYERQVKKPHIETIRARARKNLDKLGVTVD